MKKGVTDVGGTGRYVIGLLERGRKGLRVSTSKKTGFTHVLKSARPRTYVCDMGVGPRTKALDWQRDSGLG